MKKILRLILGLGLVASLLGCAILSAGAPTLPAVTFTPSIIPSPTETSTPTPSPTPTPTLRIENGDKSLFNGDTENASLEYREAFKDSTDPDIKAAALWGLARAQAAEGRHNDTLTTLQQLITDYPNSIHRGHAYFLQGQTYNEMHLYNQAAIAYQQYLKTSPGLLDSYVQQLRGDALTAGGDNADALTAYTSAQEAPHLDDAQTLQIKIAQAKAGVGDYAGALALYDAISSSTTNDYTHAQMDYLSGEANLAIGKKDDAYKIFLDAVENYPLSIYAYNSLVELVNAKVQVNYLDRGLVDYFAAQNGATDINVALAAFDHYIAATPTNDGTVYYYRALCLEQLQNYQGAVDEFTYFIQHYAAHPKWADAWNEKAYIQWVYLNQYPAAADTLLAYVQAAPSSAQAPDALMSAARILERDGRFDQAGKIWERVANEYPSNDQISTAVFLAGIMQYRQSDYKAALQLFQRSLVLATAPEDKARALMWIGKDQLKLGNTSENQAAWQLAQSTDPGGYYSERTRDLLAGRAPFTSSSIDLNVDMAAERKSADAWMRLTFKLPADTDLSGLGPLTSDPRVIRGSELWSLGQYEDARLEFEDLRNSVSTDAVSTYRLANYLLDIGLYRSSIFAARQVLTLAGLTDSTSSMLAPAYFNHIRYGLYYNDLIVPAAQSNKLDPLFLFSVVRQESLFEGFVNSAAGARGLMQIVPDTGATLANAVGWPPIYDPEKLYSPKVSIVLGAYYLASNRNLTGDIYGALAAYNGGPGNALEWEKLSGDDPDLFLESVRYEETRQYIRNIYEIYVIYKKLYGAVQ
jgi:soluble lytic murein transglycosylase